MSGTLYVFRAKDRRVVGEAQFKEGSLEGEWVAIPGADEMDEDQLEAASDKAGAMVFARPEDGAWNTRNDDEYFFVTTGGAAGANELGRIYSLAVNRKDPTQGATLTVVSNADKTIAGGGDTAISPDNIDVSGRYLMVQEDGTLESRLVMAAKGRDGSIWRYELSGKRAKAPGVDVSSAKRVVTLSPPGRDGVAVNPGVWETSGIIDADRILGADSWLFDVQAHLPTAAPAPDTVEDGQLLLLRRTKH